MIYNNKNQAFLIVGSNCYNLFFLAISLVTIYTTLGSAALPCGEIIVYPITPII